MFVVSCVVCVPCVCCARKSLHLPPLLQVRDGSRRARPLRVWEWLRELCQRNNSQPRKEGVRVCSKCAHMAIADWGAGNGS